MTDSPLFRPEVMNARQGQWLGAPGLAQPVPFRIICYAGLCVTVALMSFLTFASYTHRIRLSGQVVPSQGVVRVFAPADGRIVAAPVVENTLVRRGEPLFTLDSGTEIQSGATAPQFADALAAEEQELTAEIARQRDLEILDNEARDRRLIQIEQSLLRYDDEIRSVRAYANSLQRAADQYRDLAARGLATLEQLEDRESPLFSQLAHLATLEREMQVLREERINISAERQRFEVERASRLGELHRLQAQLRRTQVTTEAQQSQHVTAPIDGIVTAIIAKPNEMVQSHAPILSILPSESRPEIHLMAPARAIGLVREGSRVVLRYSAFPHQKFGQHLGAIKSVSRVAMPTTDAGNGEPLYRIIVVPDEDRIMAFGRHEPLQPGMTVEADLLLDRRKLYEWVITPLLALRNDVTT